MSVSLSPLIFFDTNYSPSQSDCQTFLCLSITMCTCICKPRPSPVDHPPPSPTTRFHIKHHGCAHPRMRSPTTDPGAKERPQDSKRSQIVTPRLWQSSGFSRWPDDDDLGFVCLCDVTSGIYTRDLVGTGRGLLLPLLFHSVHAHRTHTQCALQPTNQPRLQIRTLHLQDDAAQSVDHRHDVFGAHEVELEAVDAVPRNIEDLVARERERCVALCWGGGER